MRSHNIILTMFIGNISWYAAHTYVNEWSAIDLVARLFVYGIIPYSLNISSVKIFEVRWFFL